ncbi:MAG: hypothetical protein V3T62_11410 [Alphaproteobacteria bacterium]
MQALSLETLADPATARYGLAAHCWRCSRWHNLDIAELVARHGNRSAKAFQPRFSRCGERAAQAVSPISGDAGLPI